MTDTRRIAVVSAGLSTPSSTRMLADRLAATAVAELAARGIEAHAETFELRDYAHDITNNLLAGFAPPALEKMLTQVATADGLIAVTPIFSTSYSGLFKSFVDVLDREALVGTPVLIGANAGTARHSLAIDYAIRPLFAYLHAEPVSTGVFAASSDWGGQEDDVAPLAARIERGAREFADALAAKPPATAADPFDPDSYLGAGRSFSHLLGGLAGQ
ncbi:CE1759 family FMN reductase [Microbacterium album]|uniref:Flavoprotein n=1 Tax=Microbacterium album TaxID=2053191 RepID=A0A917IFX0_9MICO|nr:CE1759 family FMN reductase [Microbacterium album]GGH46481.1 flavoprotein [Microbacterium album]